MSKQDEYIPNARKSSHAKWVVPLFLGAIGLGTYHYLNQLEEDTEGPKIEFIDESDQMAMWLDEEFDMTANLAAGRMPSVDMISRGVNFYNGDNYGTRPRGSAWRFTYDKGKTFSEPFNWQIPDQLVGVPSVNVECATANGVTELYTSDSLESLQTTAKDTQSGFSQSVDLSAGLSVPVPNAPPKASVGAKTTQSASLQFGNSNAERHAKQSLKEGYELSISNQARAKIFEIEMDGYAETSPQFQAMFKAIQDNATAHNFVKFFGTHWIEKAKFGASFDKSIFIDSGHNYKAAQDFKQTVTSSGFSAFGFGSSSKTTKSNLKKTAKDKKIKNIKVVTSNQGSVDFSGLPACSNMGKINAPVMVDQQLRPYYVLPDLMPFPQQTAIYHKFNKEVYEAANRCRTKHCGSRGDCKPDKEAWSLWGNFKSFDAYFIQDPTLCLKHSMFKEQQKKDSAADAAAEKVRQAEIYKKEHCVEVWGGEKFTGPHFKWCLNPDDPTNTMTPPDFSQIGFNDQMRSIKVGKYVTANLFEHNLNNGMRWAYKGPFTKKTGITAGVSSMQITKNAAQACVYIDFNLQGALQQCFTFNSNTGWSWYQLGSIGWNDNISSLWIPEGVTVQMFEHFSMQGAFDTYTGPNKRNAIHNDWYSSMKVCRGACP